MLAGSALRAQNLNQRVEVTNEYEAKVLEAHRDDLPMTVPDSVTTFSWNFDYSVFDTPYAGAYEFKPYKMDMVPVTTPGVSNHFYLKAGAGYTLHPTLTLAWDPILGRGFEMGVTDHLNGYAGPYRGLNGRFSGYDFANRLNVGVHYAGKASDMTFTAGYGLVAAGDTVQRRYMDDIDFGFRIASTMSSGLAFDYDFGLDFRLTKDRSAFTPSEIRFGFGGGAGYDIGAGMKIVADAGIETLSGFSGKNPFKFEVAPHVQMDFSTTMLMVGFRVSVLNTLTNGGFIFPDISLRSELLPDKVYANLEFKGGNSIVSVFDQISASHFVWNPAPLAQSEAFRIGGWFDGTLFSALTYKLGAGYRKFSAGLLESISAPALGQELFVLEKYGQFYADATLTFKNEHLDAGLQARYTNTSDVDAIAPAAFTCDAHASYIWQKRYRAGISLRSCSARTGHFDGTATAFTLPGYYDLGFNFEYGLSSRFALWSQVGNALMQNVRRSALHAEPGIEVTAGIRLNLR